MNTPLMRVRGLHKHYVESAGFPWSLLGRKDITSRVVDDVDFDIYCGETVGLVGETGCGKSTTGKMIAGLLPPTAGSIHFDGADLGAWRNGLPLALRREISIVFQNPFASLNPRKRIGTILRLPLTIHGMADAEDRVATILKDVGFDQPLQIMRKYPHELSGGQRQRICIGRALITRPRLVILDEPVASLDMSVRATVLNLLKELQDAYGLTYLLISHDLGVIKYMCNRTMVMYMGQIVESAETTDLFARPSHPYTQALLAAIPASHPGQRRTKIRLTGELPNPASPPSGCRFHTRCPLAEPQCSTTAPVLSPLYENHQAACHVAPRRVSKS